MTWTWVVRALKLRVSNTIGPEGKPKVIVPGVSLSPMACASRSSKTVVKARSQVRSQGSQHAGSSR